MTLYVIIETTCLSVDTKQAKNGLLYPKRLINRENPSLLTHQEHKRFARAVINSDANRQLIETAPIPEERLETSLAQKIETAKGEKELLETAPTQRAATANVEELFETAPTQRTETANGEDELLETAPQTFYYYPYFRVRRISQRRYDNIFQRPLSNYANDYDKFPTVA